MAREDSDDDLIKLDLRPGRQGGADSPEGFIQVDARDRLIELLTAKPFRPLDEPAPNRPRSLNVMPHRSHDAVFINARRGAGKTTFLVKVLEQLQNAKVGSLGAALYSLGIIDPTLIETKQHVVVVVIDRIRTAVSHARARSRDLSDTHYEAYKQSLRRLARGLTMLDGIGVDGSYGQQWADPEYVLDRGLEDARAGFEFELELQECIENACRYLGIDSFVLAVDDVDTWFERGWPVVEALRKYLTSPRLQIVLSGDMELYGLLLRSSQWKQMGQGFLQAEQWQDQRAGGRSRMAAITNKVDELQDQYLIKVLKPERRIDLQSLLALKTRLRFRTSEEGRELDCDRFGNRFATTLLAVRSASEQRQVMDLLLRLPTRSALQVMIASRDLVTSRRALALPAARTQALDTLRHVAWTELTKLGLAPGETVAMPPAMLPNLLADWFTTGGLWRTMPRFHPEAYDPALALPALFGAALSVSAFRQDPAQMPIYWLKISVVREMLDAGLVSENEGERAVKRLADHLHLGSSENALQTVSRLAAFELEVGRRVQPGIYFSAASVPLGRLRERDVAAYDLYGRSYIGSSKPGSSLLNMISSDEKITKNVPAPLQNFHRTLASIGWNFPGRGNGFNGGFANGVIELAEKVSPAAGLVLRLPAVEVISGQRKKQGGYSFLRLIATFAELLQAGSLEDADSDLTTRVRHILTDAALLRSYPTPGVTEDDEDSAPRGRSKANQQAELVWDDNDDADAPTQIYNDESDLIEAIVEWVERWHGIIPPLPPVVLSRIWARFTYTHRDVRENLKHLESRFLGTFMFRTLVAFLHAVLIESVRAHDVRASPLANNNPVTSLEPFTALIEEVNFDADLPAWSGNGLKFADALCTFPLWAFFLPREPDIRWQRGADANRKIFAFYEERRAFHKLRPSGNFTRVFYRPDGGERFAEFNGLYDLLNTVHMQGNPKKRGNTAEREVDPAEGL